jgi:hypothetical protein
LYLYIKADNTAKGEMKRRKGGEKVSDGDKSENSKLNSFSRSWGKEAKNVNQEKEKRKENRREACGQGLKSWIPFKA